jgi:NMT1-like family
MGMRRLLPALCLCVFVNGAHAAAPQQELFINIVAGEATWLSQAAGLASKLDHENGLRILPILGAGGVQALQDLTRIQSVDAAIVSSDSLAYAKSQNLLPSGKDTLAYVAKLAPLELVLIARTDIKSVTTLAGKRIATGPAQSATFASGELLFNALEISFKRVPQQGDAALQALVSGQADAALVLGTSINIRRLPEGKYHVLSLAIPPDLQDVYQPAMLTSQQLPGLMEPNGTVETIAASLTLAVQNWPRNSPHTATLKIFEAELYKAQSDGPTANLAAIVPGWTRHSSAQDLLDQTSIDSAVPLITPTGGTP